MKIVNLKLSEITPYENNPRINRHAVEKVANSIKQFGFKNPIIVDSDKVIICGHTRHLAGQQLKLKTVPCIIADDLTDEQIRAYRIADNKVGELSYFDFELLEIEIAGLDFNWSDFGFDFDDEDFNFLVEEEEQNKLIEVEVVPPPRQSNHPKR